MKHRFNCVECGLSYTTDYYKPGKCPRCWAQASGFELGKMAQGLVEQVGMLERDLYHARNQNQVRQSECHAPALDMEMIKRLIQLTHPDKHGGSQAAQIATAWLLEQREELR